MSLNIATGLVTSKLNSVVGDVGKGLGLDENSRDADSSKALVEREAQRKKEERARHKEYIHESREVQRKHLHNKYTLDVDQKGSKSKKKTSATSAPPPSSTQPASERQGGQDGDKKCIVS